jgi:hypothetical protein
VWFILFAVIDGFLFGNVLMRSPAFRLYATGINHSPVSAAMGFANIRENF